MYLIARGIDLEAVTPRFASKSIACCKKFPGRNAITGIATLNHWFKELGKEIIERLEKDETEYNRKPKQLVVSFMQTINGSDVSSSRSVSILPNGFDEDKIANEALDVLKKNTDKFFKNENCNVLNNPIKFLGLSVGKFENTEAKRGNTIQDMFRKNLEVQTAAEVGPTTSCGVSSSSPVCLDSTTSICLVEEVTDTECVPTKAIINEQHTNSSNQLVDNEASRLKSSDMLETKIISSLEKRSDGKDGIWSFLVHQERTSVDTEPSISFNDSAVSAQMHNYDEPTLNIIETESQAQNVVPMEEGCKQIAPVSGEDTTEADPIREPLKKLPPLISVKPNNTTAPDYTQTYAEFHRPADIVIPTVVCPTCNKNVEITEMQTHTDAHIAYQLSQEQREEFRSQLKTTTKLTFTSPPPAKRQKNDKKIPSATALNNSLSIDRFLIKKDASQVVDVHVENANIIVEAGPSTSFHKPPVESVEMETCNECHKSIPITQIIEHTDYHLARKLQMELQQELLNAGAAANCDNRLDNNEQRNKNNNVKNKKKTIAGSTKSVASFFTK